MTIFKKWGNGGLLRSWTAVYFLLCHIFLVWLYYFISKVDFQNISYKSQVCFKKHSNFTLPSGHVLFLGCSFMSSSFEKNTLISFFWVIEYWLRMLVEMLVGGWRVSCPLLAKRLAPDNLNLEFPSWNLTSVCAQWQESHPPGRVQMRQLRLSEAAYILTVCPWIFSFPFDFVSFLSVNFLTFLLFFLEWNWL